MSWPISRLLKLIFLMTGVRPHNSNTKKSCFLTYLILIVISLIVSIYRSYFIEVWERLDSYFNIKKGKRWLDIIHCESSLSKLQYHLCWYLNQETIYYVVQKKHLICPMQLFFVNYKIINRSCLYIISYYGIDKWNQPSSTSIAPRLLHIYPPRHLWKVMKVAPFFTPSSPRLWCPWTGLPL